MAKTYGVKELRTMYAVSAGTFRAWLRSLPDLQLKPGQRILTPHQVQMIFKAYGMPE